MLPKVLLTQPQTKSDGKTKRSKEPKRELTIDFQKRHQTLETSSLLKLLKRLSRMSLRPSNQTITLLSNQLCKHIQREEINILLSCHSYQSLTLSRKSMLSIGHQMISMWMNSSMDATLLNSNSLKKRLISTVNSSMLKELHLLEKNSTLKS